MVQPYNSQIAWIEVKPLKLTADDFCKMPLDTIKNYVERMVLMSNDEAGLKLKHEFIAGVCQRVQQEIFNGIQNNPNLWRLDCALSVLESLPLSERGNKVAMISSLQNQIQTRVIFIQLTALVNKIFD